MAREERPTDGDSIVKRRQYLKYATLGAAAGGLAGCTGGNGTGDGDGETEGEGKEGEEEEGEGEEGEAEEDEAEERPEGVSEEAFESGPVPDAYMTATSLGNEERNPDDLSVKSEVSFSEFDEAQEKSAYEPGSCCANCADYIPDKNADTFGACAEVEGYIDGADWCAIYEGLPEPEVPEGMSEDDLATADVPEEYRTASSQAGEERTPDDLRTHEEVGLTESVEAIADGTARPGQSCGNCADFIPDKNGDTWGACAAVEGYIAAEDWCSVWESISEDA
jgi:hypothetical protein